MTNHLSKRSVVDFLAFAKSLPQTEFIGDPYTAENIRYFSIFIKPGEGRPLEESKIDPPLSARLPASSKIQDMQTPNPDYWSEIVA